MNAGAYYYPENETIKFYRNRVDQSNTVQVKFFIQYIQHVIFSLLINEDRKLSRPQQLQFAKRLGHFNFIVIKGTEKERKKKLFG